MRLRPYLAVAVVCATVVPAGSSATGAAKVPRPTEVGGPFSYGIPAVKQIRGQRSVVHYVTSGPDAVPPTDVDRDRVPDYAERVAEVADFALGFFTEPVECERERNVQRCWGDGTSFRPPLPDTGGPDSLPDLYLTAKSPGSGFAVSPAKGSGGAFILISTELALPRPGTLVNTDTSRALVDTIVGHELFHLVHYAHAPAGVPEWIFEGTANLMASRSIRAFIVAAGFNLNYFDTGGFDFGDEGGFDAWTARPWRSLASEEFTCEECYGTQAFWSDLSYRTLHRYLELARRSGPARDAGVGQLGRALRETSPRGGPRSVADALGAYWERIYRNFAWVQKDSPYDIWVGRLRALQVRLTEQATTVPSRPSRRAPPPPGILDGLATHFVPLSLGPRARSLRLVVETEQPLVVRLFVGRPKDGSSKTFKARRIDPKHGRVRFLGRRGHSFVIATRVTAEQRTITLMLVSGTWSPTRYRIRYSAG